MSSPNQTVDLTDLHTQLSGLSIAPVSQRSLSSYAMQPMQPSIFRQMYKLWAGQHNIVLKRDIPRVVEGHKFNSARLHAAVLLHRIMNNCSVAEITLDGWMAIGGTIGWNSSNTAAPEQASQFFCEPQAASRLAELYHQFLEQFDSLYLSGAFRDDLTEIPMHAILGALGSRPAISGHTSAQGIPELDDHEDASMLARFHKKYASWASTSHTVYIWRLMIVDGALLDLYTLYTEALKITPGKLLCSGPQDGWFHWTILGGRLGYGRNGEDAPGNISRSSEAIGLQLMVAFSEYIAGFIWKASFSAWLLGQDDSPFSPFRLFKRAVDSHDPGKEFEANVFLEAFRDMNLSAD